MTIQTCGAKALTIIQPWATLAVLGIKKFETRTWKTNYRGKLYIHAGLHKPMVESLPIELIQEMYSPELAEYVDYLKDPEVHLRGQIIGIADLVDCYEVIKEGPNNCAVVQSLTTHESQTISGLEYLLGNYTIRKYAWKFENPYALDHPFRIKGNLGLWTFNQEVEKLVHTGRTSGTM